MLVAVFAISILQGNVKAQNYSGGDGTQGNPYKISTAEDLVALSTAVANGNSYAGKYFELQNDIDMSSVENFTPIGSARYNVDKVSSDNPPYIIYTDVNTTDHPQRDTLSAVLLTERIM